eukprot:scaffold29915_cov90-Isochrysis_galbana.AAC.2
MTSAGSGARACSEWSSAAAPPAGSHSAGATGQANGEPEASSRSSGAACACRRTDLAGSVMRDDGPHGGAGSCEKSRRSAGASGNVLLDSREGVPVQHTRGETRIASSRQRRATRASAATRSGGIARRSRTEVPSRAHSSSYVARLNSNGRSSPPAGCAARTVSGAEGALRGCGASGGGGGAAAAQQRTSSHAPSLKSAAASPSARSLRGAGARSKRIAHRSSPRLTSEKGSFGTSSSAEGGWALPVSDGGSCPSSSDWAKHASRAVPPGRDTHAEARRATVPGPDTRRRRCSSSSGTSGAGGAASASAAGGAAACDGARRLWTGRLRRDAVRALEQERAQMLEELVHGLQQPREPGHGRPAAALQKAGIGLQTRKGALAAAHESL